MEKQEPSRNVLFAFGDRGPRPVASAARSHNLRTGHALMGATRMMLPSA